MTENIRIVNLDGKLVGLNESDDLVPVSFDDLEVGEINTNEIGVDELTANSVSTERISTSEGTVWDRQENSVIALATAGAVDGTDNTTSTTYDSVADATGAMVVEDIPAGATLYGRIIAEIDDTPDGETGFIAPQVVTDARDFVTVESMELESPPGTSNEVIDSGWSEITENVGNSFFTRVFEAKVTGGEFRVTHGNRLNALYAWRLE